MTLTNKIKAFRRAHINSGCASYPVRLALLGDLAEDLGLKMQAGPGVFELYSKKPGADKKPLLTVMA